VSAPDRGTVVLHAATAMNDIISDTGFVDIDVVIAIDHKTGEVIDGDISYDLLERRLRRDGWDVVDELDEFTHDGSRWVQRVDDPPATGIERAATIHLRDGRRIEGLLANVPMDSPDWEANSLPVREEEGDPAIWWFPFDVIAHIEIG